MTHRRILPLILVLIALAVRAQEQDYNEDKISLSKVPASVLQAAEKAAAGAKFQTAYKDNEKDYRLVGKTPAGKDVSVKVDREGMLRFVRTSVDVAAAKLPRTIGTAIQGEIQKNPQLKGFQPTRISLVDKFNATLNDTETFYEFFGRNAENVNYLARVDMQGTVSHVGMFLAHPNVAIHRDPIALNALPAGVRQGVMQAAPGVKLTQAVKESNDRSGLPPEYVLLGRADRGRAVELRAHLNGHVYIINAQVALREVPKAVLDIIQRKTPEEKDLKGFRPAEARRMQLLALGDVVYLLYGKNAEGKPLEVRVNADGTLSVSSDSREDADDGESAPTTAGEIPSKGLAVLAARFGREDHWTDVTDFVRKSVKDDRLDFQPAGFPDPAFGSAKALVILYSNDGKVGLSITRDNQPVALPIKDNPPKGETVPERGLAVLAARYGVEERWDDVTDAVRDRVTNDRLEGPVADLKLPDPAPNVAKDLVIAYARAGKVGLYVIDERRRINFPLEEPPVNSFTLEVRNLEFAREVSSVAFTPDGRRVVAGIEDGTVRVLDATTGREAHRFEGHGPGTVAVAVSASGNLVLSGGADKLVRLWDLKADRERTVFRGHIEPITRVALTANGRVAASAGWDRTVRLWDIATGRELRVLSGHTEPIHGIKFTPDSRQLVSTSWDQTVRVWDVATGKEIHKFQGDTGKMGGLAISKDGRQVFFGDEKGIMRAWEPASGREPASFNTYEPCSWDIALLPDGLRMVFTDFIVASIWDYKQARPTLRLERHVGQIKSIAVSPDGRLVATGSSDKTVRIWKLPEDGR